MLAKREPFRAGVRMRLIHPRVSIHVTRWLLNHAPAVKPNDVTLWSAVAGVVVGVALVFPGSWLLPLAAFVLYQIHIMLDYVDGELARVTGAESPLGGYYDLMVGRLVKPVILYAAAVGTWLDHPDPSTATIDLVLGTFIVLGFFLDKEAVDCWYRANEGVAGLEDRYAVRSDYSLRGSRRLVVRAFVSVRSIHAFLIYQVLSSLLHQFGIARIDGLPAGLSTPRDLILVLFAVAFPLLALVRTVYISRTRHVPRRQDLVKEKAS